MKAPRIGQRSGFTVLEVVLAMFILLLGMTSILALLSFGGSLLGSALNKPQQTQTRQLALPNRRGVGNVLPAVPTSLEVLGPLTQLVQQNQLRRSLQGL